MVCLPKALILDPALRALPERHNSTADLIVMLAEAHRSHGGETHKRMRQALPSAA